MYGICFVPKIAMATNTSRINRITQTNDLVIKDTGRNTYTQIKPKEEMKTISNRLDDSRNNGIIYV